MKAQTDNRIVNLIFWAVVVAVAAIAAGSFALSFNALHDLALQNKQPAHLTWIWPVIVDLSLVIYTAAILAAQLQRRGAGLPIFLTVLYAGVTVIGNIIHGPQTPVGWFVASLPPISLILGTELLRSMAKSQIKRRAVIATLDDLQHQAGELAAQIEQERADAAAERDRLAGDLDRLSGQRDRLKAEIGELKKEQRASGFGDVSDDTREAALAILEEQPDISGSELGRLLDRSGSTGRRLRRELLPVVAGNGHHNGNGNGHGPAGEVN